MAAVALMLERHLVPVSERRERWEDVRDLRLHVAVERVEEAGFETVDVLVQRVDEDRERKLTLELRCRPPKIDVAALLRAVRQLAEQACLADSGLADELDRSRPAFLELIE